MISDATIAYTWAYSTWLPQGPHGNEFMWHDRPEKHRGAVAEYGNLWFYEPECPIGFLDGHVEFLRLGPYDVGDSRINTDRYILDPQYPQ